MRNVLLSLSAVLFLGLVSCSHNTTDKTTRQMSATIKRNSADSGITWNANANLVKGEIPFNGSVRFIGSEYATNPTSVKIFINNYKGVGTYPLYQGSAQQTDSNSALITYISRDFHSLSGSLEVIRDDKETYIGRFSFIGTNLNDTITIKNGSFTITK
jgi:hypothetical protein